MTQETNNSWAAYYKAVAGHEPRPLFVSATALILPSDAPRQAIDLGCGVGVETLTLLSAGWHVLAIDQQPESMQRIAAASPPQLRDRLQLQQSTFEEANLIPADFIYAGYSLPFCNPNRFGDVWARILDALRPNAILAVDLFGIRDTWATNPDMTFFDAESARRLFDTLTIESFEEQENDGPTATGGPKHWHIFKVIARKSA